MTTTTEPVTTVTITRDKQYKSPLRNERYAWKWIYSWSADDNGHMYEMPGGRVVNLGRHSTTHLASLRDDLRRRYGRQATIVEAWKS